MTLLIVLVLLSLSSGPRCSVSWSAGPPLWPLWTSSTVTSLLVACLAGFAGNSAPRAVFLPFVRPGALRIMAGTLQKDSCPRRTGKLDYLGDDLVFFYDPCIWQSHVRCCCLWSACVGFPGRRLLECFRIQRYLGRQWMHVPFTLRGVLEKFHACST